MTYTPTHLAVQGLIVWLLLSKNNKAYYKEHRWEFIIINLVAIFPDIDLLFGYHRTYTHSLIIPTFTLQEDQIQETKNQTVYVYAGNGVLDDDLNVGNKFFPGRDNKGQPYTGVGAIVLKGNFAYGQTSSVILENDVLSPRTSSQPVRAPAPIPATPDMMER